MPLTDTMKCDYLTLFCLLVTLKFSLAAIGGNCTANDECTDVSNAVCDVSGTSTCICQSAFKPVGSDNCTGKGIGDNCTISADCVAVNNSVCNNSTSQCECPDEYSTERNVCFSSDGGNQTDTSDPLGLGDACRDHSSCSDVDHAECTNNTCTCANGYKKYGIVCITVLNAECNNAQECTDFLANSTCDTKCVCVTNYTAEENVCKIGHGMGGCSAASDCVSNAVCDDNNLCKCEATFTPSNGLCVASGAGKPSVKLLTDIVLVAIIAVTLIKLF